MKDTDLRALPDALQLLAVLAALLLCLLILPGCAWYGQTGPAPTLATQSAACILVERLPASAGYLQSASGLFRAWGTATNTAPDAAAVREALAAIPNARLTVAEQSALWSATVLAYDAARKACQTPADFAALQYTLLRIGDALSAAVALCGPPPVQTSGHGQALPRPPTCDAQGVFDLAKTIKKDLR